MTYNHEFYLKNKEHFRQQSRQYYLKNRDKILKYIKEYRLKNLDKIKLHMKAYNLKNKEKLKQKRKENYIKNKEKILSGHKIWAIKNKEYLKSYNKLHRLKNLDKIKEYRLKNKEKQKIKDREYRLKNKEKLLRERLIYNKKRFKTDLNYKFRVDLGNSINNRIKYYKGIKASKTVDLIGCSIKDLRLYLQKLFKPGMSWNNYRYKGWHIDHIKPCKLFDLTKKEEQLKCFHYTNLQPLWWYENLEKNDKYPIEQKLEAIKI